MDALLWALAILFIIPLLAVGGIIGVVLLAIAIPIGLIWLGVEIGGPLGGILVLIGLVPVIIFAILKHDEKAGMDSSPPD